ncbi:MAG: signal peptidase II [Methylococcales bacterium]
MPRWLILAGLVLILDQLTKIAISSTMGLRESIYLIPYFQLTYVHNEGAAFSFLSDAGGWQRWFFIALSSAVSVVIAIWLYRLPRTAVWESTGLSLVLGGAMGNLIDRVIYGYVIDFLDVYYKVWHWPAFNIADSGITVGVCILLLDSFRNRDKMVGS